MLIHYGCPVFISNGLPSFMREMTIAKPNILFLVPLFIETFSNTIWRTAEKQGQTKTLRMAMTASNALMKVGVDKRQKFFSSILEKFGGNLKYIICGGAALDPRYVKEFRTMGIDLMQGYGITECSPVVADQHLPQRLRAPDDSVVDLPSVEVKIDDPDSTGRGEILVRGPSVMLGYYNDPHSTADAIRDGWFCTGDLAGSTRTAP